MDTHKRIGGHLRIMQPADDYVGCFSWGTVLWRVVALIDKGTLFGVRVKQKLWGVCCFGWEFGEVEDREKQW